MTHAQSQSTCLSVDAARTVARGGHPIATFWVNAEDRPDLAETMHDLGAQAVIGRWSRAGMMLELTVDHVGPATGFTVMIDSMRWRHQLETAVRARQLALAFRSAAVADPPLLWVRGTGALKGLFGPG